LTTKRFTGQYHESSLPGGEGLSYYNARWYDAQLGRFLSADNIVSNFANPKALNRFAYVLSNPLRYRDPSGHVQACADGDEGGRCGRGSNEIEIWQLIATRGRHPWFADAYASIYVANHATLRGDQFAEGYQIAAETALQQARNFLPQSDWRPNLLVAVDPGSTYHLSSAVTSGGAKVFGMWAAKYAKLQLSQSSPLAQVPNPWGINGKPDHQAAVKRAYDKAIWEFEGRDVYIEQSKSIKDALGLDRRPDVIVRDSQTQQVLKVYEAARVDEFGNFVSREQQKMFEYWEIGLPYYFEPVR